MFNNYQAHFLCKILVQIKGSFLNTKYDMAQKEHTNMFLCDILSLS